MEEPVAYSPYHLGRWDFSKEKEHYTGVNGAGGTEYAKWAFGDVPEDVESKEYLDLAERLAE